MTESCEPIQKEVNPLRFRKLFALSVPAMLAMTLAGPMSQAEAVAIPARPGPALIVVSSEVTRIAVPVVSTRSVHHRHRVTLTAPRAGVVATGSSRDRRLTVLGAVRSSRLRPGCASWMLSDTDGSRSWIPVCVVGRTRVVLEGAGSRHGRYDVFGTVSCYRFQGPGQGYGRCPGSRGVHLQELDARGRWHSVRIAHPDRYGHVRASVEHARGTVTVRWSIPWTPTTGGASSESRTIRVS